MSNFNDFFSEMKHLNPWTNVYGLARTILALGTLLTLVLNDTGILIRPLAGSENMVLMDGLSRYGLFGLIRDAETARWTCIVILLIVASGFMPRYTAIFHAWVTYSYMIGITLPDGGDQVATVLSMLLLPLCLTDNRKWHWNVTPINDTILLNPHFKIIGLTTFWALRLQVALIYFEACVGKFKVVEWANGTALYYWLSNPIFGLSDNLKAIVIPVLANEYISVLATWGVLALEAILFLGIAVNRKYRGYLLVGGIAFHFMIIFAHGLPTFFLSMTAALILFLRPYDMPFSLSGTRFFYQWKFLYKKLQNRQHHKKNGEVIYN